VRRRILSYWAGFPDRRLTWSGINIHSKSERSPLLARRGGCGEAADGVLDQAPRKDSHYRYQYCD